MGVCENAVGAADMVINHLGFLLQEGGSGVFLMLNDLGQNLFQTLDDSRFGLAQCHLVGHLENVAERFCALAAESADRKAELVDRLDNWLDLLGENQARQMQHG